MSPGHVRLWTACAAATLAVAVALAAGLAVRMRQQQALDDELVRVAAGPEFPPVRTLIAQGANVNARCSFGTRSTPLHAAAPMAELWPQASTQVVDYLLKHGADVNRVDGNGNTPVHVLLMSREAPMPMIRMLLDGGAGLECRNSEGCTALMQAVRTDHLTAVRELLRRGSRLDLEDEGGRTVLQQAYVTRASPELIRLLKAASAR